MNNDYHSFGKTPEASKNSLTDVWEEALALMRPTPCRDALEAENQSQNGSDGDNGNGGKMVRMEMVRMEMVRMEMVEMEIQMRMVERTIGTEAAFAMSWRELMKIITKVYCPRTEIQKIVIPHHLGSVVYQMMSLWICEGFYGYDPIELFLPEALKGSDTNCRSQ
ncbi:hypothetical protein Tco_1052051 [Tanacetum coccineum]